MPGKAHAGGTLLNTTPPINPFPYLKQNVKQHSAKNGQVISAEPELK